MLESDTLTTTSAGLINNGLFELFPGESNFAGSKVDINGTLTDNGYIEIWKGAVAAAFQCIMRASLNAASS